MRTVVLLIVILGFAAGAWAGGVGDAVEVRILSDSGRELPIFPVSSGPATRKAYAEAIKGEQYDIVVRNRLNKRVGIVVAVDGRNIISGKKSWLKSDERMYILEPYAEGEFKGWRTGEDRINRFYFTTVDDSYAAAFGDESAMGVIAVAVYPEVKPYDPPVHIYQEESSSTLPASPAQPEYAGSALPAPSPVPAPSAGRALGAKRAAKAMSDRSLTGMKYDAGGASQSASQSAGTGYGQEEYSQIHYVPFEPEYVAAEKVYLKYEWHETLCQKGVITCGGHRPHNRMWGDNGFASPPPGRN